MKYKEKKLALIGFFIHLLLLLAVFELYFSSPVDNGIESTKTTQNPPANRVVLIVADGLRANSIYGTENEHLTPYLTSIRKSKGSWGISYTRVPTESRPGHVAILAGIYEDPSAILKGWKKNPVNFDSVVNQSENAWCWGSPDIVNLFKTENLSNIHLYSYNDKMQDFGKSETTLLDFWVFDQIKKFFHLPLPKEINKSGNLFFLHLLGIDTAGHGYKPNSKEYKENIKVVDKLITEIEYMFEYIFPDRKTAYIFTSDHGMTDWGSHGAGSDDETLTPIIVWGAGIKKENIQKNINQIDIAPMISSLIGINLPINSMGKIPYQYFRVSKTIMGEMMEANVKQLMKIFNTKRSKIKKYALHFVPFKNINSNIISQKLHVFSDASSYSYMISSYDKLIENILEGIDYYQNYYKLYIQFSVTIGFIGWILYIFKSILCDDIDITDQIKSNQQKIAIVFISFYIIISILLYVQKVPVLYYAYFLFPFIMSHLIFNEYYHIQNALNHITKPDIQNFLMYMLLFLSAIELMFLGFYQRIYYSLLMCFMGGWITVEQRYKPEIIRFPIIILCCILTSIFPLLPEMKTNFNQYYFSFGSVAWLIMFFKFVDRYRYVQIARRTLSRNVAYVQITQIVFAIIFHYLVELNYITADSIFKNFAWSLGFLPIFIITGTSKGIYVRLTTIFLGFASFYILVSPNYELLFMVFYTGLLYAWLLYEMRNVYIFNVFSQSFDNDYSSRTSVKIDDFRRALFFMIIFLTGFFGTGNVASLNSFDPMWVRCFLTIFSPFTMTTLILLKIMVPFIFAICTFHAINIFTASNIFKTFCIVMLFSDIMVLHFFYYITNVGSWLEIGMSLSHFIIMELFVIILLLLYGLAYALTSTLFNIENIIPF